MDPTKYSTGEYVAQLMFDSPFITCIVIMTIALGIAVIISAIRQTKK